jgi:hypothetical protein
MKPAGWIFLVLSWGVILALCAFCFRIIFRGKAEEHLVAPLEIETEPPGTAGPGAQGQPPGQ